MNELIGFYVKLLFFCGLAILSSSVSLAAESKVLPPEWDSAPTWSPDGKIIAVSYSKDGKKIFKDKNGKLSIQFNSGYFRNRKTILLNSSSYEKFQEFKGNFYNHSFSSDGRFFMGSDYPVVKVFEIETGKCVLKIEDMNNMGSHGVFDNEGRRVAAFSSNKPKVFFLDKKTPLILEGDYTTCEQFSWSRDGLYIAARCSKSVNRFNTESLVVWNSETGKTILKKSFKRNVADISWSPDGKWFAFANGELHIMDSKLKSEHLVLESAYRFMWSENSRKIAYEGKLGKIKIVTPEAGKVLANIQSEKFGNSNSQWWQDDKYLVISGFGSSIAIFDGENGKILGATNHNRFHRVLCSPNSNSLLLIQGIITASVKFLRVRLPKRNAETPVFENGTNKNPWKDQVVPTNLEEAIAEVKKGLGKNVSKFKNTKEKELYRYTSSMGMGIPLRNSWRLWGNSPIADYFHKRGLHDGTDISTIIIESTWRDLNNIPVNSEKVIADCVKVNNLKQEKVVEDRFLPSQIVDANYKTENGSRFVFNKIKSKVKIITYTNAEFCKPLIERLQGYMAKYSDDKLQMIVILNKNADQMNNLRKARKREVLEYLSNFSSLNISLCSAKGLKKAFESFITEPYPDSYKERYEKYIPKLGCFLIVDRKNRVISKLRPVSKLETFKQNLKSEVDSLLSVPD